MPRQYKDILMDYRRMEAVASFPSQMYCLSATTVQMILALSESFYWHTRWQMPPDESPHDWTTTEAAQIKLWAAKLEAEFLSPAADCSSPTNCLDCIDYAPSSPRIEWTPQNPFTQPDLIPSGWALPPFFVVDEGTVSDFFGAQVGDVLSTFERYAYAPPDPPNYVREYPHFRVNWNGAAEVEIHLLNVPQGGLAIAQLDGGLVDLVEMSSASAADFDSWIAAALSVLGLTINGEVFPENIIEYKTTTGGAHFLDVTFIPSFSLEEFVGWGGGLRKVTICGEIGIEECQEMPTRIRLSPENTCMIQVSYDDEETWEDVVDLEYCAPTVRRIRQNPENPCHIEYSPFTEGDVWFVVADLRLCRPYRIRGGILEWFDGTEWTPIEGVDTVYDEPPPYVPRPETAPNDKRCSSASSAAYAYTDLANRLFGILNQSPPPLAISAAADLAGAASNVLNFFLSSDIIINLSASITFQLNAMAFLTGVYARAGIGAVPPANQLVTDLNLTDPETREKIKCALYCQMSEAGNITSEDAFNAIDAAIAESGLEGAWSDFIELFGAAGVNAAISVNAFSVPASECVDCVDCVECGLPPVTFALPDCYELGNSTKGSFADTTLDEGFGNPAPCAKSGNGSSGGFSGFAIRAAAVLFGNTITEVTFDYYWNGSANPSNVLAQNVELWDSTGVMVASWYEPSNDGQAQNTWHTRTVSISGSDIVAIVIDCGVVGGGTGAVWVDNISWE